MLTPWQIVEEAYTENIKLKYAEAVLVLGGIANTYIG